MADNTTLNTGTGGHVISDEDIGGVHVPRSKILTGAAGVDGGDVSVTNPLPVEISDGTNVLGTTAHPVKVDGSAVTQPVSGTVAVSGVAGAVTVDSELTTADLDTGAGSDVRAVVGVALAESGGAQMVGSDHPLPVSDNGGSLTVDGTVTATLNAATNAGAAAKTTDFDTGAGVDTVTMLGIALPASGGAVAGGTATNPVRTDPTGTTTQPVSLATVPSHPVTVVDGGSVVEGAVADAAVVSDANGTLSAKLRGLVKMFADVWDSVNHRFNVGATQSGTWTVQPGNTANTTAWKVDGSAVTQPVSGTVGVSGNVEVTNDVGNPLPVSGTVTANLNPTTTGGLSIYRNISLLASGVSVKGSAGQLYGYYIYNGATSVRFVKFYNKATAATVGSDTPVMTLAIPASSGANVSHPNGIAFSAGISVAATTLVADADTTAPSANDCIVNLYYA